MRIEKVKGLLKAEIIIGIIRDLIEYTEDEAGVKCDCMIEPYIDDRCCGLAILHTIATEIWDWQRIDIFRSGNSDVMFVRQKTRDGVKKEEGFNDEAYADIANYVIKQLVEFEKKHE